MGQVGEGLKKLHVGRVATGAEKTTGWCVLGGTLGQMKTEGRWYCLVTRPKVKAESKVK